MSKIAGDSPYRDGPDISAAEIVAEYRRMQEGTYFPTPLPLDAQSAYVPVPQDTEWGEFHIPNPLYIAPRETFVRDMVDRGALRVTVFGSLTRGICLVANMLQAIERNGQNKAVLTGVCTDGSYFDEARISARKRVWQFLSPEIKEAVTRQIMDLTLESGVPCFTGKVKSDAFEETILPQMYKPDVAFMGTFGQAISKRIFDLPQFGMYNFHPSDLANGKYPGPNPFSEMLEAGETTTRMTAHWVSEGFDEGRVVGYSPEVCVEFEKPERWTLGQKIIALHARTSDFARLMSFKLVDLIHEERCKIDSYNFEDYIADLVHPEALESLQSPVPGEPEEHCTHGMFNAHATGTLL